MAARKNKLRLTEPWREKIRTSMILNRVQDHIEGKVDLSNSQVTAALGLLKKTISDAPTELTGANGGPVAFELAAPWLKQAIQRRNS